MKNDVHHGFMDLRIYANGWLGHQKKKLAIIRIVSDYYINNPTDQVGNNS